jgi:hypothetical protein
MKSAELQTVICRKALRYIPVTNAPPAPQLMAENPRTFLAENANLNFDDNNIK